MTRALDWTTLDRFVAGPYQPPGGEPARAFEVPKTPARHFRFGRIVSGAAWPAELSPLEREAPVPLAEERAQLPGDAEDGVLWFETRGERMPLCVRGPHGPVWSVDPGQWIEGLLAEAYVPSWKRPLPSRVPLLNYSRVPHVIRGVLEKLQSPRAAAAEGGCPRLPLDDLVDEMRRLCFTLAFGVAPRTAALWPGGRRAAVTLTHDVDTGWILDEARSELLARILHSETSLGFKGAWYVTGDQLKRSGHEKALRMIADAGHELGSHGWNHDSKLDYLSPARQEARMRKIRRAFGDLDVEGVRTPWYCRSPQLSEVLSRHFSYDSSVPNASGFFSAGSNSGCCTLFPYRLHGHLPELPMTLPPDTSLDPDGGYDLLRRLSGEIVERGGVVVVTLHPQPHQSANPDGLARYFAFLRDLAGRHREALWSATPAEIVRQYEAALSG